MARTDLLQGTLDLLILRILDLGPNHGWGIATASARCHVRVSTPVRFALAGT